MTGSPTYPVQAATAVAPSCEKLVVFFSRGMSLEKWERAGILQRELALYRELLAGSVTRLSFVTYGGADDVKWETAFASLQVLPNRWGLPSNLYSVVAPWLHRESLRDATVFKTNQVNGAWCAVVAKALFGKALVVRCGFLWADRARQGGSRVRHAVARAIERIVMRSADHIIAATAVDAAAIARQYGVGAERITVIPNYVDTQRFRPLAHVAPEKGRITFVGRLEPEKNVESLIDALEGQPAVTLVIVGDGSLRAALESRARARHVTVEFTGRVPHDELPAMLNRADVFVLPSHYEGHPKALVEAMACGVPVVGARTPGIRDVVVDRDTGLLCGVSAAEIRAAVLEMLADVSLRARVREAALRYVRQQCSLANAVSRESGILASVCAARPGRHP